MRGTKGWGERGKKGGNGGIGAKREQGAKRARGGMRRKRGMGRGQKGRKEVGNRFGSRMGLGRGYPLVPPAPPCALSHLEPQQEPVEVHQALVDLLGGGQDLRWGEP